MNKIDLTRKLTVREFFKRFPSEEACLEHIMTVRYGHRHTCGKCGVVDATFHRLENGKAYADGYMDRNHQFHPWEHRADGQQYRAQHGDQYRAWRHDDPRHRSEEDNHR